MLAIIDKRMNENMRRRLTELGFELLALEPWHLQAPVASHPDMLIFCGFGAVVCERGYYESYPTAIDALIRVGGYSLLLSDEKMGEAYPHDVLFNALPLGGRLICNTKHVSRVILELCRRCGVRVLHANQGYARCSALSVDDNAIITADPSIAAICRADGVEVLEISSGSISLPGYGYGFIGGSSGICGDIVYLMGDVNLHPDGDRICRFISERGKEVVCLSDSELCDFGGIIFN